jgi:hypothetical protein
LLEIIASGLKRSLLAWEGLAVLGLNFAVAIRNAVDPACATADDCDTPPATFPVKPFTMIQEPTGPEAFVLSFEEAHHVSFPARKVTLSGHFMC